MDKTSLGDRMKNYENSFQYTLPARQPIIIRIDGKAFHSYTRGLKPFSWELQNAMNETALKLCEEIQGCQLAYVQSDEISLFLHSYKKFNSQGWFGNELIKICSVSAGIASATFTSLSHDIWQPQNSGDGWLVDPEHIRPAYFDSRAFIVPESDVNNYFIWRQQDWQRNSVQMLARSIFSHKECYKKNNTELKAMCFDEGKNWEALSDSQRLGRWVVKSEDRRWAIGPAIKFSENPSYIKELLSKEEG